MNKIDLLTHNVDTENNRIYLSLGIRTGRASGFSNTLQKWMKFFMGSSNGGAISATRSVSSIDQIKQAIVLALSIANGKMRSVQSGQTLSELEKFKDCSVVSIDIDSATKEIDLRISFQTEARTTEEGIKYGL